MQLEKVKSKNGFLTWPNMALTKHGFKTKNWSHLEKDQTVERRGKERRRGRGREEEEEKKREKPRSKVWNYKEF